MSSESRTILQIIPCVGEWVAIYEDADVFELVAPVACWALVEEIDGADTFRSVEGIDPTGEGWDGFSTCSDLANFKEYRKL